MITTVLKAKSSLWLMSGILLLSISSCKKGNVFSSEDIKNLALADSTNNSVELIVGDSYDRKAPWSEGDYEYPYTHVYIQVGNYPKVELPFDFMGAIYTSTELSTALKDEFKKEYEKEEIVGKPVIAFSSDYADAGSSYVATRKGNLLRFFSRSITQEENQSSYYHWIATYNISAEPQLIALSDMHYYTPKQLRQDFFEPITYSDKEIADFIKENLLAFWFFDEENIERNYKITERYKEYDEDQVYLFYDTEGIQNMDETTFYQKWNKIYDIRQWGYHSNPPYLCGGDIQTNDITVEVLQTKKDTYFYTADVNINYKGYQDVPGFCRKHVRIVQMDGFLYFDGIFHNSDIDFQKMLSEEEVHGDYPEI